MPVLRWRGNTSFFRYFMVIAKLPRTDKIERAKRVLNFVLSDVTPAICCLDAIAVSAGLYGVQGS